MLLGLLNYFEKLLSRNSTDDLNSAPEKNVQDNSGISRDDFPDGFIFGTGTSAYQVEGAAAKGGRGISVWDDLALRTPSMILDGSNGNVACDMYRRYKEDIKMMKQMGFDAYRFSISWSRVLPGGRTFAGVNQKGINYYNDVIDTVIANGMTPYVTLFHWDLPNCLQLEYGGMISEQVVNDFVEFAHLCFEEFGDRVKFWATLNEPSTYSMHGYSLGPYFAADDSKIAQSSSQKGQWNLPSHRLERGGRFGSTNQSPRHNWFIANDPAKDAYTVSRNLLLCHSAAVKLYRTSFQKHQNGQIGIVLSSGYHYPFDSTSQNDIDAVQRALDFTIGWFLEPVIYGQFPASILQHAKGNIAPFSVAEQQELAGSADWVGLNYYTSDFVRYDKDPPGVGYPVDQHCLFSYYDINGNPVGLPTDTTWLWMVPNGLYDLLHDLQNRYKQDMPPLYITENGVADTNNYTLTAKQACADTTRVKYHQDHLAAVLKAINKLSFDVRGYFAWSYCDNFEWTNGYTFRFGIVYTDYANNLTRYKKNSALWFTNFLKGEETDATTPPTSKKRQLKRIQSKDQRKGELYRKFGDVELCSTYFYL